MQHYDRSIFENPATFLLFPKHPLVIAFGEIYSKFNRVPYFSSAGDTKTSVQAIICNVAVYAIDKASWGFRLLWNKNSSFRRRPHSNRSDSNHSIETLINYFPSSARLSANTRCITIVFTSFVISSIDTYSGAAQKLTDPNYQGT